MRREQRRRYWVHDFTHGRTVGPFTLRGADRVSMRMSLATGGDVGVSRVKSFALAAGLPVRKAGGAR